MRDRKPQLDELTAVRFFAALWVVVYHQSGEGGLLRNVMAIAPAPLLAFCRTGYAAVGTFFMLSGFILTYTYDRGGALDRRRFWVARLARIYPTYLLALVIFAPFVQFGSGSPGVVTAKLLVSGLAAMGLVQAWHPDLAVKWNTPGWSLSAEAFFYALFPTIIVLARRIDRSRRWPLVAGIVLCWLAAAIAPAVSVGLPVQGFGRLPATAMYVGFWGDAVKFNPLLRLPEFVAGVLLGRLFLGSQEGGPTDRTRRTGWTATLLGAGGVVFAASVLSPYVPLPVFHNCLLLPFNALLIYGLATLSPTVTFLRHRWLVLLGASSYALYILQLPTYHWTMWGDQRAIGWAQTRPGLLFVVYFMLLVGVSVAAHLWVEEPGRVQVARALTSRS